MTEQTEPAPVDWIDGHPQLEAIAAAVWEHCRTEGTSLVVDDPRNIAVAALAAVLPASVDRADVLREVEQHIRELARATFQPYYRSAYATLANDISRLADETPTAAPSAVVVRRAADETPGEAEVQLPFIHVDDDGDQLDIGAVMASTYDGEAPVVCVAAEQHQGDTVATVYVRPERVDAVIAALRSARLTAETLPAVGAQQPKEAHALETVAYRSNGGSLLRCIAHAPEWATILCGDFHPVTSEDLPDGGLCTMPDCGVDVLIPQQPKENRP